jgi:hypothetical protein
MFQQAGFSALDIWRRKPNVQHRRNQMPNNNPQLRVLSRMGARELSSEESEQISGSNGAIRSLLSVIRTLGGSDFTLDE